MAESKEVKEAKQAAVKNLRENAGRDQATFERAVDIAEKAAKRKGH